MEPSLDSSAKAGAANEPHAKPNSDTRASSNAVFERFIFPSVLFAEANIPLLFAKFTFGESRIGLEAQKEPGP